MAGVEGQGPFLPAALYQVSCCGGGGGGFKVREYIRWYFRVLLFVFRRRLTCAS